MANLLFYYPGAPLSLSIHGKKIFFQTTEEKNKTLEPCKIMKQKSVKPTLLLRGRGRCPTCPCTHVLRVPGAPPISSIAPNSQKIYSEGCLAVGGAPEVHIRGLNFS